MIEKVISGGQTGADIAGVKAAKACGIKTGGFMPLGYKTADGPKPEYEDLYSMVAIELPDYAERTRLNVIQSDCTVRFAHNFDSPGEKCTARYVRQYAKPCYDINCVPLLMRSDPLAKEIGLLSQWLSENNFKIVNIAENRENPNRLLDRPLEQLVFRFLVATFEEVNHLTVV